MIQKCKSCHKEYEAPEEIWLCKTCTGVMWVDFCGDPDNFKIEKYITE